MIGTQKLTNASAPHMLCSVCTSGIQNLYKKNLENKGKKTKAIVLFNMDVHICIFLGFIWVKILKAPF